MSPISRAVAPGHRLAGVCALSLLSPRRLRVGLCALMACLLLGACGDGYNGQGLGRPDFTSRTAVAPKGVVFSRLVAPRSGSMDGAFVELINRSGAAIDLAASPMTVQTHAGAARLPSTTWLPDAALTLVGASMRGLDLHAAVGEMVLLGPNLEVEAYAAWGADPNTLPGGLLGLARGAGLSVDWATLPYPVAAGVAVQLDPIGRATPCVSGANPASPPFAAVDCLGGAAAAQLWLSRVVPLGSDPAGSSVELMNPTPAALDLTGVQLCARGRCAPLVSWAQDGNGEAQAWLPPATQGLVPGASDASRRRIVLAGGMALAANDLLTDLPTVASHDEVVLLAPGAALTAGTPWGYVRMSTSPARLPAPGDLGARVGGPTWAAWQNVTLAAPRLPGESLALASTAPGAPGAPSAWSLDNWPMGTQPSSLGTSTACSAPARPAPIADLAVAQISQDEVSGLILLENLSDQPLDLSPWVLAQGPALLALKDATDGSGAPSPTLAAHGTLWVRIADSTGQCANPYDVCWSDPEVRLAVGELTLLRGGAQALHLQWGAASLPSLRGQDAAAANVWPHATCRSSIFSGLEDGETWVRLPATQGQSPADYGLGAPSQGVLKDVAEP